MGKATVSVSLPTSLLSELDERVDRGEADDRSAAIEEALTSEWNLNKKKEGNKIFTDDSS